LAEPGIVVTDVVKTYRRRGRAGQQLNAVDHVSLTLHPGQALGLVGQSGSGKTTLARLITGVERPTSGTVEFDGVRVDRLRRGGLRKLRSDVQMVFQDPYAALNPMHTVEYVLTRPLVNYLGLTRQEAQRRMSELLDLVGLTPVEQFADKLPHQLSGGQRQRVVIARALASEPKVIIADEPVSMLDVSLRAGILKLLAEIRERTGTSLLYITHDLLSARVATSEILVLHRGTVVERGETVSVLQRPKHEYTQSLIAAIPNPFARDADASLPHAVRGRTEQRSTPTREERNAG
jgi:peptide/nickel transport system ATP-binding protein